MNATTLDTDLQDIGGKVKKGTGKLTGDSQLQGSGMADEASAKLSKGVQSAKEAVTPLIGQATQFAKDRPWATAALAGAVGIAVINTLRGK